MLVDRSLPVRALALILGAGLAMPLIAQDAAPTPTGGPLFQVDTSLIYAMVALTIVQVIFILSLGGIIRVLGGPAAWGRLLSQRGSRAAMLVPFALLMSLRASAQTYKGDGAPLSNYHLFWILAMANVFLFVILIAQIVVVRSLTKAIVGTTEQPAGTLVPAGPTWVDRLLKRLTRQVKLEEEKDILMHHEYDGIRELDNVLPPWWLWLFYGSIIWSVVYIVNVHIINIWPDQKTEYTEEMTRAKAEVDAYMATLTNTVDENNVTATAEPDVLAAGKGTFNQFCTPCHGADGAGSETSVGPNLTDAHWIHGGGMKNVFKTIKYGVPEKGMISWKAQLQPAEIRAVSAYILSLEGTGSATQKAPQGEIWTETNAPADSTGTTPDSTVAPADTARLAAK